LATLFQPFYHLIEYWVLHKPIPQLFPSVTAVEKASVGDVEVTHEFAEVAERGFQQEM
jgi:hypothetical protein